MKILSVDDIRLWDQYTIRHEPISSINLMERAARKCAEWLNENIKPENQITFFCGKGNNGGDGLAIARLLSEKKYSVVSYVLETGGKGSDDFQVNLSRLQESARVKIHFIQSIDNFPVITKDEIIIDALFGSGLNRGVEGLALKLIEHINQSANKVISIDIPSGLFADKSSTGNSIVKATYTLSFQCYKLAFLVPENAAYFGEVHIMNIGLHDGFLNTSSSNYELINEPLIHSIYKPRKLFAHKGKFGHALLVTGSYGKIGASVLSAKACLRSGVGLLTCHIPKCGYEILQTTVPEAMVSTDINTSMITRVDEDISQYQAIGIGPGIGTAPESITMLEEILNSNNKPLILDADALNIIALKKEALKLIPHNSILTPHPKEFERLFGDTANDFERIKLAQQKARELSVVIILKGHHTFIATMEGNGYFNVTGNPGMATAGSGDVLTGILTGLLAQGYNSTETAILGVYLHGLAGDFAAIKGSQEAMIAGDIIENIGAAFHSIAHRK